MTDDDIRALLRELGTTPNEGGMVETAHLGAPETFLVPERAIDQPR